MKPKFTILLISISLLFLLACNFSSNKPIETEEETINALVGTWTPEDQNKADIKELTFVKNYEFTITNSSNEKRSGQWFFEEAGKVKIKFGMYSGKIILTNSKRMVLNDADVLIKK
jgi:hypothetical protein